MINFSSFYKQYGNSQTNSNLIELLADPSTSLLRLLDNENFIAEFKASSTYVQQFMTYRKFQQLLSFVTEIGDEIDKKRSFKFPLTACELLSCETAMVFDKLIPEGGLIIQEQKIITPVQQQFQQEVQDDDDQDDIEVKAGSIENEQDKRQESQDKAMLAEKVVELSEQVKIEIKKAEEDDQFGEFVKAPSKKMKTIKLKQVVDKIIINKIQYQPLISNLFYFFTKTINYTLTGYVCKILTTILNKRTTQFLALFFQSEKIGQNLIKSIESRSVVDLIIRICTIQSRQFINQRYNIYRKLAQQLSVHQQVQVVSNISSGLCQVFEKINVHLKTVTPYLELKVYINKVPELLEIFVRNISQRSGTIYSAPIIYQLLSSFSTQIDQDSIEKLLISLLQGIFLNLQRIVQEQRPRIGINGVKIIQILNLISKNKKIQSLIIQKPLLFNLLIKLIKFYPSNNILHGYIFKLFNNLLIINTSTFVNNILQDEQVLLWLQSQTNGELQRLQKQQKQNKKCYIGHIINLCVKLKDLSTTNDNINVILQKERYVSIMKVVNDHYLKKNNNTLAGYSKDRSKVHLIMFSKEDILASYSTFLANARPSVFKVDQDDPLSNPALLQELQKQLDGINVQYQKMEKETLVDEQEKRQLFELNELHPSGFWKAHIEYDVDALLKDLS